MVVLTEEQTETIVAIERSMGIISVACSLLLLVTFLLFKEFRNVGNTMIFMATPANLIANSAAIIGMLGMGNPSGPLCQFQAFALEWFEQSDPYWSCAASINVLLIFYRRWTAERIKKYWWVYCLLCYGLPFIPAIILLFYRDKHGPMYGDAIIWCFVGQAHAWTRIYSFYGPVWLIVIITLTNYVLVGIHVFRARSRLHAAKKANQAHLKLNQNQDPSPPSTGSSYESRPKKGTEARDTSTHPTSFITQQPRTYQKPPRTCAPPDVPNPSSSEPGAPLAKLPESSNGVLFPGLRFPPIEIRVEKTFTLTSEVNEKPLPSLPTEKELPPINSSDTLPWTTEAAELRPDKGEYTCVISSEGAPVERRDGWVNVVIDFLVDVKDILIGIVWGVKGYFVRMVKGMKKALEKWEKMDEMKYRYTKTALLFTVSILITWVPSSANRLYGILQPNGPMLYPLNIATAVVLPLQGFWNCIIFFSTSLPIIKTIYHDFRTGKRSLSLLITSLLPSYRRARRNSVGTINIPLAERTGSRMEGVESRMGGVASRAGARGPGESMRGRAGVDNWDIV